MATFIMHKSGVIYFYHWLTPKEKLKVSTKIKIEKKKWNKWKEKATSNKVTYNGKIVNVELIKYRETFYKALIYCEQNDCLTLENLRNKYRKLLGMPIIKKRRIQRKVKIGFVGYFKQVIDEYKSKNIISWKSLKTTLNHIDRYFQGKDPSFESIDSIFYINFGNYLIKQNQSMNTIDKHWKHIKSVMNLAYNLKLHNSTEYVQFKRHKEKADTIYLTVDEIKLLEGLNLTGMNELVRDYFLIGYYTALRYSDWDKVKSDIINKDNIAIIKSSKTGETSTIPIHDKVIEILNKYNGVMPKKPVSVTVNKTIKELGKAANIVDEITTRITRGGQVIETHQPKYTLISSHTARRSFATNLILEGVQPNLVMKITGHKSLISFEKYIRFDELEASEKLKKLKFFK